MAAGVYLSTRAEPPRMNDILPSCTSADVVALNPDPTTCIRVLITSSGVDIKAANAELVQADTAVAASFSLVLILLLLLLLLTVL